MNPFINYNGELEYKEADGRSKRFDMNMAPNGDTKTKAVQELLNKNLIFDTVSNKNLWYQYYNRFGWINLFENDQPSREYLFFTKPELDIGSGSYNAYKLNPSLEKSSVFMTAVRNHKEILTELQYSVKDINGDKNPFMRFLTNCVTSKMDLPSISSEFNRSTQTVHGAGIDYRTHSMKSDFSYDFTLSFRDTAYMDIYYLAKYYDEYIRLAKLGDITFSENFKTNYIKNYIIPEQFSVFKFIVGSDGETILYFAKATGVSIVDVPRSDMGDPGNEGFKYSLSFHANFVEDSNDNIIDEFNSLTLASMNPDDHFTMMLKSGEGVSNAPAKYARVVIAKSPDKRVGRRRSTRDGYDYRLVWTDQRISSVEKRENEQALEESRTNNSIWQWFTNVYNQVVDNSTSQNRPTKIDNGSERE